MSTNNKRYMLTGTWSGYNSSQARIVHTEVVDEQLATWASEHPAITFDDGTHLWLEAREMKPTESCVEKPRYYRLIHECFRRNVTSTREAVLGEIPKGSSCS